MTSQQVTFETFYDDQVDAHRQLHPQERVWDRFSQPSIVLSVVVLLVTVAYNLWGSSAITSNRSAIWLGNGLWDGVVWLTPASLLYTLDDWVNPSLFPRPMNDTQQSTHAAKSDTMRRVLGMDSSGGMMATVFQARSRALSMTGSVLGLKLDGERPPGLGNRDNSCYQNSILQGLAALHPLPNYLSTGLRDADTKDSHQEVTQTLRALISDLNDASNNGKTLWTPGLLKSMSTWTQQDAQEYYSKILDDIDKGVAKASKVGHKPPGLEAEAHKDETMASQHSDDSGYQSLVSNSKPSDSKPLRNPLEGLLAQRVACVQCGHSDGLSMIPFNCLTLSLGLDKNQHDLYERLDSYSRVESIEGVECGKCTLLKAQRLLTKLVNNMKEGGASEAKLAEPLRRLDAVETALEEDDFEDATLKDKCKISAQGKVTTTKTKQIVIARPPQSLAVHMNRSVFDPSTFNMMKNSAPVNFPLTLDFGPWCLGSAENTGAPTAEAETVGSAVDVDSEERWLLNPRSSMVAGDLGQSRLSGPIYELRAVVTHYGRHENGHYICYRKFPRHSPPLNGPADQDEHSGLPDDIDGDTEMEQGTERINAHGSTEKDLEEGDEVEMDWWRLSDHNVSKVDEETVLSLSPGVFMLFYDCVDASMILQKGREDMQDATQGREPGPAYDERPTAATDGDGSLCGPKKPSLPFVPPSQGVTIVPTGDTTVVGTEDGKPGVGDSAASHAPMPAGSDTSTEAPRTASVPSHGDSDLIDEVSAK